MSDARRASSHFPWPALGVALKGYFGGREALLSIPAGVALVNWAGIPLLDARAGHGRRGTPWAAFEEDLMARNGERRGLRAPHARTYTHKTTYIAQAHTQLNAEEWTERKAQESSGNEVPEKTNGRGGEDAEGAEARRRQRGRREEESRAKNDGEKCGRKESE